MKTSALVLVPVPTRTGASSDPTIPMPGDLLGVPAHGRGEAPPRRPRRRSRVRAPARSGGSAASPPRCSRRGTRDLWRRSPAPPACGHAARGATRRKRRVRSDAANAITIRAPRRRSSRSARPSRRRRRRRCTPRSPPAQPSTRPPSSSSRSNSGLGGAFGEGGAGCVRGVCGAGYGSSDGTGLAFTSSIVFERLDPLLEKVHALLDCGFHLLSSFGSRVIAIPAMRIYSTFAMSVKRIGSRAMDGFTFSTPVRVRFADTDAQGIAHNSAYVVWFEVARVEYLRAFAGGYQALRDQGIEALVLESLVPLPNPGGVRRRARRPLPLRRPARRAVPLRVRDHARETSSSPTATPSTRASTRRRCARRASPRGSPRRSARRRPSAS